MIGVDTNVLLRLLLDDDADQARRARALVAAAAEAHEPVFVNRAVLCETLWVLGRGYRFDRNQIARAVELLLAAPALRLEDHAAVDEALTVFRAGTLGFVDALIGVLNRRAGCATTYTFDRRAAEAGEFTAVE
ncbi:MAG: PIN domain-containing protein [Geminicoccaceae bacterium]